MAKSKRKASPHKRGYHKRLEEPVHNLLSYGVLLILALVVMVMVYSLHWFINP